MGIIIMFIMEIDAYIPMSSSSPIKCVSMHLYFAKAIVSDKWIHQELVAVVRGSH